MRYSFHITLDIDTNLDADPGPLCTDVDIAVQHLLEQFQENADNNEQDGFYEVLSMRSHTLHYRSLD